MKVKLSDIATVKMSLSNTAIKDNIPKKMIAASNLLANNEFTIDEVSLIKANEEMCVLNNCILIKRVSPIYVNYFDQTMPDVYVGNNLIMIIPEKVDGKFLASYLNKNIEKLVKNSSIGNIPTIGRKDVENFIIPDIPMEQQIKIGSLWFVSKELTKLKERLNFLENIKNEYMVNKYMEDICNGKK